MIERITLLSVMHNEVHRVDEWIRTNHHLADEIIVVDQGSTDGTGELLKEYAAVDPRITILHDECRGYGEASRLMAWDAATSPWVLQLDADEHVTGEFAAEMRDCDRWPQHRQRIELVVGGVSFGRQTIYRFVPKRGFHCPTALHTCFMPDEVLSPSMGLYLPHYTCIVDSKNWVEHLAGEQNYETLGEEPAQGRFAVRTPFLRLARMMGLSGEDIDAMDFAEREHYGFVPGGGLH